jgi:uncharacterized protein (DUF736 family)
MGDRRKCQTYAASPAEPGGLPDMLGADWSPEIGAAWRQLLAEIDQFLSVADSKPGID